MTDIQARTRIKICGITRPGDALCAAAAGADAVGLVFYAASPRAVTIERAREICAVLPPFVTRVALFVDPDPAEVERILDRVPIDRLQFHGDERAADCERYGLAYIKAARVQGGFDLDEFSSRYAGACGILVDTYQPGVQGGTGRTFDWSLLSARRTKPLILAGGLTPENVAEAIRRVHPHAVDVSGGVESAPGIKDAGRMMAFVREVRDCDCAQR